MKILFHPAYPYLLSHQVKHYHEMCTSPTVSDIPNVTPSFLQSASHMLRFTGWTVQNSNAIWDNGPLGPRKFQASKLAHTLIFQIPFRLLFQSCKHAKHFIWIFFMIWKILKIHLFIDRYRCDIMVYQLNICFVHWKFPQKILWVKWHFTGISWNASPTQDRKQGCLESFFLDKQLGEASAGEAKKNPPFRRSQLRTTVSRWWFQRFFIFTPTWRNDPNWLIFFQRVGSTTN